MALAGSSCLYAVSSIAKKACYNRAYKGCLEEHRRMLFVWIALWLAAGLLLISDRRNPSIRWLSLVSLCGGMGALASVMEGWIVSLELNGQLWQVQWLRRAQRGCSWISYYGLPYSFLNFALAYYGRLAARRMIRLLPYVTLFPAVAMLALPIAEDAPVHYAILAWWALPYIGLGTLLLLRKRGGNQVERRAHFIVTAAVLPAVLIAVTMNHVMPLFGLYGMWRYNVWPIALAFLIFIIALFNFGFLGVRLFIERQQMDYSLRAITSGTAMLNHAIKNDIGKIKLFSSKIEHEAVDQSIDNAELRGDVKVIAEAAQRIETMIRSVHERTQELPLQLRTIRLGDLVEQQVVEFRRTAGEHVHIIAKCDAHAEALIDPMQTAEGIRNVLNNALEAMNKPRAEAVHGVTDAEHAHMDIQIRVSSGKRGSHIAIKDNGSGIEKRYLRKVTEPFFSTKNGRTMNFGLGLAYCYQLMRRQGGELRIESELGEGTTVTFCFPAIKAIKRSKGPKNWRTKANTVAEAIATETEIRIAAQGNERVVSGKE